MRIENIELENVPNRGRESGLYGEKNELVQTTLDSFIAGLDNQTDSYSVIEIIDDERIFNNNNDLRRMFQKRIEDEGYGHLIAITMRKGRVFLMDMYTYNHLLIREAQRNQTLTNEAATLPTSPEVSEDKELDER